MTFAELVAGSVARRGARAARLDAPRRRRRRPDRRGRGVRPGRRGEPLVPRPDDAQRDDVRATRPPLRLPLLRAPLVRERRLRGAWPGRGAPPPGARADARPRRDGDAPRARRPAASLLRPRAADAGARDHGRARRRDLAEPPFALVPPVAPAAFEPSPRIGISRAAERPWRYVEAGTSWSSRARRAA